MQCPGQDNRYWDGEAVFEAPCPNCGLGSMPPELLAKQKNLFKDKLSIAVRKQLIGREELYKKAARRTEFAEQLCKEEQRGDMAVVLAATLLIDCENSTELLQELKADSKMLAMTDKLLTKQAPESDEEQASADIFHDACLLTTLQDEPQSQQTPSFKTAGASKIFNEE
jgi:hypothetical protein